jgi:hypothetical protein
MAHPRRSPEEIERGLTALILAGSSTRASEETGIPDGTLRSWKRDYADQYDRLCNDLEPRVVQKIAAEAESIVLSIADRERQIIESLTDDQIHRLEPKDKAATLRNLSTSKALQIDKLSSPLRERPSHVNPSTDIEGLMMRMTRALGQQKPISVLNEAHIDSDAVPLRDSADVPLSTASHDANAPESSHPD